MADRGIIFSAPMVRALLAGRKTQTRRLIKPCPWPADTEPPYIAPYPEGARAVWYDAYDCSVYLAAPHAVGDRLYVREAHYLTDQGDFEVAIPAADEQEAADHRDTVKRIAEQHSLGNDWLAPHLKLRPSIHMPRWASRMTLLVREVRVQRLQDISEEDAIAEGIELHHEGSRATVAFETLWNLLHTKPGERWEDNPWIYALTFEVVRENIDRIPA